MANRPGLDGIPFLVANYNLITHEIFRTFLYATLCSDLEHSKNSDSHLKFVHFQGSNFYSMKIQYHHCGTATLAAWEPLKDCGIDGTVVMLLTCVQEIPVGFCWRTWHLQTKCPGLKGYPVNVRDHVSASSAYSLLFLCEKLIKKFNNFGLIEFTLHGGNTQLRIYNSNTLTID